MRRAIMQEVDSSRGAMTSEQLSIAVQDAREHGEKIVFTNGCFDILHAGHVRYLTAARGLGDVLLVGLNDDASVRRLKGEERPFNPLLDRAEVLAGLECIDLVIPFAEDTPECLIEAVAPDVLVKGADWRGKGVAGADLEPGETGVGAAEEGAAIPARLGADEVVEDDARAGAGRDGHRI